MTSDFHRVANEQITHGRPCGERQAPKPPASEGRKTGFDPVDPSRPGLGEQGRQRARRLADLARGGSRIAIAAQPMTTPLGGEGARRWLERILNRLDGSRDWCLRLAEEHAVQRLRPAARLSTAIRTTSTRLPTRTATVIAAHTSLGDAAASSVSAPRLSRHSGRGRRAVVKNTTGFVAGNFSDPGGASKPRRRRPTRC